MHARPLRLLGLVTIGLLLALNAARANPRDTTFILFRGDNNTMMSGNLRDLERVKKQLKPNERMLWFRVDNKEYVVRDPATLDALDALWKPVDLIGDEQGKLGDKQGALGDKQGVLGDKQGDLGSRVGDLASKMSDLEERAEESESASERESLRKQRNAVQREMRDLEAQMRALEKPMRELGKQMQAIGREMEVLGKKMEAASKKANADTELLFARVVASGLAKRL